jgi:hypothetical protein
VDTIIVSFHDNNNGSDDTDGSNNRDSFSCVETLLLLLSTAARIGLFSGHANVVCMAVVLSRLRWTQTTGAQNATSKRQRPPSWNRFNRIDLMEATRIIL